MPETNDREAIEAQLPEIHRNFVRGIQEKYGIPAATQAGMRSRFVRSEEVAQQQLEVIMRSDVNMLACGIGSPMDVIGVPRLVENLCWPWWVHPSMRRLPWQNLLFGSSRLRRRCAHGRHWHLFLGATDCGHGR
jgi:hypothetical protein